MGILHPDPDDPPRRRANKRPGHGTFANDRPPVFGMVGRESGQIRLWVIPDCSQATLLPLVAGLSREGAVVNTDDWSGYGGVAELGREHPVVKHGKKEYARDEDGDGHHEIHCNTMEGIWTGLRNFLRPFRGVSKHYLNQYVAVFMWIHNLKSICPEFVQFLVGSPTYTSNAA